MRPLASFGVAAAVVFLLAGCITIQSPSGADSNGPGITGAPGGANPGAGSRTDCTGQAVLLNQAGATYTLSGKCGQVSVQGQGIVVRMDDAAGVEIRGDRITVDVDTAGALAISGQDNTVVADSLDAVAIRGDRNRVEGDRIRALTINGNDNTVRSDSAIGGVVDNGSRNSVVVDD